MTKKQQRTSRKGGSHGHHRSAGGGSRRRSGWRRNASALDLYRAVALGPVDRVDVRQEQHRDCHRQSGLSQRHAAHRADQAAGLAGRRPVHRLRDCRARLGLDGDALRPASDGDCRPPYLGADLLLGRSIAQLRQSAGVAYRLGRRRSDLLSDDARARRQLVCAARARQGNSLLVDRHHDRADADGADRHRTYCLRRLARAILCDGRSRAHPAVNPAEVDAIRAGAIENNDDAPGRVLKTVDSVWSNHRFWLMTIAISANAIFIWGWSGWLPTYLRSARHFTFSTSGYLTFVIYGFAVVTILILGYVSDRVFRRAPFAGLGWALAAVFLIAAALAPSATWSVVLMICALCAQQVGISGAEMLMHSVVGTADMAKSQGVRAFVTQMFGAFSPIMIGYLLAFSHGAFIVPFAVLAFAVVVAAGCMIALAREGLLPQCGCHREDLDMALPTLRAGGIEVA